MTRRIVRTEVAGKVWKITAKAGQRLAEDEPIVILESMKMEIPVAAPIACTVVDIIVEEGDTVREGGVIAHIEGQANAE